MSRAIEMYETALSSLIKAKEICMALFTFCYIYVFDPFSLYLELQNDLSQAIEMYETALSSLMKAEEICMVWLG